MKSWQALLLGSTMLKPKRGVWNDHNGSGCALGMMWAGAGNEPLSHSFSHLRYQQSVLPCGCKMTDEIMWGDGNFGIAHGDVYSDAVIIHLFNQHVCDGSWTIEQLAEWLRGVEEAMDAESAQGEKTSPETEKVLDLVEV